MTTNPTKTEAVSKELHRAHKIEDARNAIDGLGTTKTEKTCIRYAVRLLDEVLKELRS